MSKGNGEVMSGMLAGAALTKRVPVAGRDVKCNAGAAFAPRYRVLRFPSWLQGQLADAGPGSSAASAFGPSASS